MEFLYPYLVLALAIFVINMFPAFMPPTWTVLTFYSSQHELKLLPTVIMGAIFAVSGRIVLSLLAKHLIRPLFPKKEQENFDYLGKYLSKKKHYTIPFILAYAFSPIPSNQLFLTAGLSGFDIKFLASTFFLGRIISYTFFVSAGTALAGFLNTVFSKGHSKILAILIEIVGLLLIVAVSRINWIKVLKIKTK